LARRSAKSTSPPRARLATPWPRMGEVGCRTWRQSLRFAEKHPMASISATRRPRSQASISEARRLSRGPVPGRRALSPQVGLNEATRSRRSRQRRLPAPFSRVHPIKSPSSRWATIASTERSRMNSARSIFGTASKTDRAMRTQFVGSSWLVANRALPRSGPSISASGGCRHRARYRSL
jgi:hypothetical protein